MFTLADKFTFAPDSKMCFLAGLVDFSRCAGVSWNLKLHSSSAHTLLIPPEERAPGWDKVAFGIDCRDLPFHVTDWKELERSTLDVPDESLTCAFSVFEWEDLVSLKLRFGEIRPGLLEVFADGVGRVESLPEWFPDSEVTFSIHTWAAFLGVSINVPVNAGGFLAYAQAKLRDLLPGYAYGEPRIRQCEDGSGNLKGVEVFYRPQ